MIKNETFYYTLPYPPTVNHLYQRTRFGGVSLKPKASEFYSQCRKLILMAGRFSTKGVEVVGARVSIGMHPPDGRARDIDNVLKAILDGLVKGGALTSDHLITRLEIEKRKPAKGGLIEVVLDLYFVPKDATIKGEVE